MKKKQKKTNMTYAISLATPFRLRLIQQFTILEFLVGVSRKFFV